MRERFSVIMREMRFLILLTTLGLFSAIAQAGPEEWIDPAFHSYVSLDEADLPYSYPMHFTRLKVGLDWMTPVRIVGDQNGQLDSVFAISGEPILQGKTIRYTRDMFPFQVVERDGELFTVRQDRKVFRVNFDSGSEFTSFEHAVFHYPIFFARGNERIPARFLVTCPHGAEKKSSPFQDGDWRVDLLFEDGTRIQLGKRRAFWNVIHVQEDLAPAAHFVNGKWQLPLSFGNYEFSAFTIPAPKNAPVDPSHLLKAPNTRVAVPKGGPSNLEVHFMGGILTDHATIEARVGRWVASSPSTPHLSSISYARDFLQGLELYGKRLLSFVYREYQRVRRSRQSTFNPDFLKALIDQDRMIAPERKFYFLFKDRFSGAPIGFIRVVDGSPHAELGFAELSMETKYRHLPIRDDSGRRVMELTRLAIDSELSGEFDLKSMMAIVAGELTRLNLIDTDFMIHTDAIGARKYQSDWGAKVLYGAEQTGDGTIILKLTGETLFAKAQAVGATNYEFPAEFKRSNVRFTREYGCGGTIHLKGRPD